jgi:arabinoxylan arabinofuranohydrolase
MKEYKDCRNPVLPIDLHIPDSEAHVMPDGRVYVYGSWDQEENIYCSKEYRVISSENMVDWLYYGICFDSRKFLGFLISMNLNIQVVSIGQNQHHF